MEKSQRKITNWRICIIVVILLAALGLSHVVIPPGVFKPSFLGMPYSLWMGVLVTICLIIMTFIGSRVHPGNNNKNEEI
jgi:hypothetical protein